jgi:hypothetical protein
MIKFLNKIDDKLLDFTQDGYLWLFDRTGIYRATCTTVLVLASQVCYLTMAGIFFTGLICVSLVNVYKAQHEGSYLAVNLTSDFMRKHPLRIGFVFLMLFLSLSSTRTSLFESFGILIELFAIGYLNNVKLRDREPKDFFSFRQPAPSVA